MLSAGARKDLLLIQFVKSLLDVSKKDTTIDDADVHSRVSNKSYKVNKRIDRQLDKLSDKLSETINAMFEKGGYETAVWIKKNLSKRVGGTLMKIQESRINLEMLAVWVMYCNFSELKRPLDEDLKWTTDQKQYFQIIDLMENTELESINRDMFQASYDVIARIKG